MALLTRLSRLAKRFMAKSKVVICLDDPEDVPFGVEDDSGTLRQLIALRRWCEQNLKQGWRTYSLTAGGGKKKNFIVFEFDSRKDEMLFRLYTGK